MNQIAANVYSNIYFTHLRTVVIAGNGTQRLFDINRFCFDICFRSSDKFFSAALLRYTPW